MWTKLNSLPNQDVLCLNNPYCELRICAESSHTLPISLKVAKTVKPCQVLFGGSSFSPDPYCGCNFHHEIATTCAHVRCMCVYVRCMCLYVRDVRLERKTCAANLVVLKSSGARNLFHHDNVLILLKSYEYARDFLKFIIPSVRKTEFRKSFFHKFRH